MKKKRKLKTNKKKSSRIFIIPKFQLEMTGKMKKYQNLFVFVFFSILSLVVWWHTKYLPYHWDSAGFVINASRNLLQTNFKPFIAVGSDFAHPPLFLAGLAIFWKIFGETILVSHIYMYLFMPIFIFSTYLIGKKVKDFWLGFFVGILVLISPVVVAEFGMIYLDLAVAAIATASTASWIYNRKWLAGVLLTIAVGIKLPVIVLAFGFFFTIISDKKKRRDIDSYLPIILPFILLLTWLFYHYQITNWFLVRPGRGMRLANDFSTIIQGATFVINRLFIYQNKWIISLLGVFGILYYYFEYEFKNIPKNILILISHIVFGIGFYVYSGEFGLRYGIFLLPYIYIVGLYFWHRIFDNFWMLLISFVASTYLFISVLHPIIKTEAYEFRPFSDLQYLDLMNVGIAAADYIEINYPDAEIIGGFPESYQLTQPYQGYVKDKIRFSTCSNFNYNSNLEQILYLHAYSPEQMKCRVLIDILDTTPFKKFEKNGKWIELYRVNSPGKAQFDKNGVIVFPSSVNNNKNIQY